MRTFKFFIGYINNFDHLVMPEVRVHQANGLILNDVVPVQTMDLPTGRIFYLDYRYERGQITENIQSLQPEIDRFRQLMNNALFNNTNETI